jgi:hypothetical protein
MKKCANCKIEKSINEFHIRKDNGKPRSLCKLCRCIKSAEYRSLNPNKYKEWTEINKHSLVKKRKDKRKEDPEKTKIKDKKNNLSKYGLTLEMYNTMLMEQNNCCAICDTSADKLKLGLVVDHDHRTGEARKLLCNDCNQALGRIKENKNIALRLINYLEDHS